MRLTPETNLEDLPVPMLPSNQVLQAVTVRASKKEQLIKASSGVSKIAIAPAQLAAIPSLGEKDIFRSLQLLPGVSGSNESSSGLFVRGGTPDQNLVLFDGFTVYHVDHLFGFFSAFNSNSIKDVQLYKGGFDAKFGGRLSSVVDITGKDGNSEEFNVGGSLSLLSANAYAEMPFAKGKGTVLVAARRSFQSSFYNDLLNFSDGQGETGTEEADETEEMETSALGPGFGRFNTEPNSWFYDLNVKGTYRLGENVFSLSFYNGQDELDNSRFTDDNSFRGGPFGGELDFNFVRDVIDESNWGNTGSSLKWSRKWGDRLYSNALLSYSNYFSDRERGTYTRIERDTTTTEFSTGSSEANDLKDFSFKWDWEWQPSSNHKIGFGTFGSYLDIEYDYAENDTTTILSRSDQGTVSGAYLQSQSTFFDRLILTPGIRLSYFDETQEIYWEPRLQMQWLATDRIKFKAATGKYVQFANRVIREDVTQGTRDFWILADGDQVPVSSSIHYIGGISYETPNYLFDVEAYHKTLDDLTEYSTRFVLNGFGPMSSLEFEENFFNGSGVARGVELLAQKKSGALTGWISYTLGRVEHQFDVYGEDPFPASHDVTNEAKLVATYRYQKWTFGGTFVYATGRPYTAPVGAYTIDLLDGRTADHFALSGRNDFRLPDYHRLDLSVTYDIDHIFGGKGQAGISFFNVYNRSNVWYKEYDVIEGDLLETNVNLLDFTPS
ncbi:MAG: TonB-dependent receptor [Bacteroidota bacterium]